MLARLRANLAQLSRLSGQRIAIRQSHQPAAVESQLVVRTGLGLALGVQRIELEVQIVSVDFRV
jgi:hypothetical protein